MPEEKRVGFGIPILDEALSGGIPEKNIVLVSGGAGTGKSTLCVHFLCEGIGKNEKVMYISTEQSLEEMTRQAKGVDPDFPKHVEENKLKFMEIDVLGDEGFLEKIYTEIEKFKPKRIVVDSLSTFSEFAATTDFARKILMQRGGVAQRNIDQIIPQELSERTLSKRMLGSLIAKIRGFGATVLMTSELPEKGERLSSDGISEFITDGVVLLYYFELGDVEEHAAKIRKMRYTSHEKKPLIYTLTEKGIDIKEETTPLM
ncbi:MAG: ATPase domain-containing protein [Candidatus Omnitrophota bacterium]